MSKGTLGQVVKRAISDAGFRRQLQSDPEGALKGFDLTSDERAALRSGDASKLSGFGIDQRMSKAFTMGEGAAAASKAVSGGELSNSSGARAAFIDQDSAAGNIRSGILDDAGGSVRSGLTSEGSGVRTALGDQHDGGRAAIGDDAGGSVRSALTDAERLGQVNAAFEGGDNAGGRSALDNSGTASREGTAYITADEAGRDSSPASFASSDSSDSSASTAFMTSDEMGSGSTAAQSSDGDSAADALPSDTTTNPWLENPEHQG